MDRLSDTATGEEDAKKTIATQAGEIEMLRTKISSLERELVDTERSLKAQNESLEHRQHESWVSQRQEARKSAEAQLQTATLRSRLTVVESQLVERELDLSRKDEEIEGLKTAVEKMSRASLGKQEPGSMITRIILYHSLKEMVR